MSWLLPTNRKLRHLEGISIRNIALVRQAGRPRQQTIDDESLPSALKSPAKLLALRDGARLEHSKSSSDLKASTTTNGPYEVVNGSATSPRKPGRGAMRRRSTLNWMDEPPNVRQKLLSEVVSERRPDTFFSLHGAGMDPRDPPIYVSELKEKSMNPDFKFFSLADFRRFSREDAVVIRIWSMSGASGISTLLVEAEVYLPSLIRIGKTLESFYHPLGDNTIVFHMTDGVYASISDLPDVESVLNSVHAQPPTPRSATLVPRETSSFDALMKLQDLAECIEDAEKTRAHVAQQIETMIREHKPAVYEITSETQKQASLKSVKDSVEKTRNSVRKLREERAARTTSLQARRMAIESQDAARRNGEANLQNARTDLDQKRARQIQIKNEVTGQVRRVSQGIQDVFPIEPIEKHTLCFTIRSHYLPNARVFEKEQPASGTDPPSSEDATAAALGYIAFIVLLLESYLMIPLPYQIQSCGSASTIFDPLSSAQELGLSTSTSASHYRLGSSLRPSSPSQLDGDTEGPLALGPPTPATHPYRTFPLYQQSAPAKRFRWAIYLLNRDIEELMQRSGCRVMDPRNTLANLKFLLTVLASGKGEMPRRKTGIVKGLEER